MSTAPCNDPEAGRPFWRQKMQAACRRPRARRLAGMVLLVLLGAAVTLAGYAYHCWVFEATAGVRFYGDLKRNYDFGRRALEGDYFNIYEDQIRDNPDAAVKIDYPPLRLATFSAWAAWNRWTQEDPEPWRGDYNFNAFLMCHNQVLEWLGAVAAFLIVRYWLREVHRASLPLEEKPGRWTGVGRASVAFLALWFDPGVAIIAHGWPSPNMWVIPYYLWTVYLCLRDRWFCAGLCMAVGSMLQGQQLLVAGIFLLWPVFAGRPSRAFRWASGFLLLFALCACGWLLTRRPDLYLPARQVNWPAVYWVGGSALLLAIVGLRSTLSSRLHWAWFVLPAAAAVIVLLYPAAARTGDGRVVYSAIALALVALFWWTRWSFKRYLLPLTAGLCLLACMPLWGATDAWWEVGFRYGTERWPMLVLRNMSNLSAILQREFGWRELTDPVGVIGPGALGRWPAEAVVVTIRQLLLGILALLLVVAAAASAMQWRRRGRNLLVALALPWALFYVIAPQMSPRYAVFAAGVGAICIGASTGAWLLMLMFSFLCLLQTGLFMYWHNGSHEETALFNDSLARLTSHLHPGLSWALLLATATLLWLSLRRPGRPVRLGRVASLLNAPGSGADAGGGTGAEVSVNAGARLASTGSA